MGHRLSLYTTNVKFHVLVEYDPVAQNYSATAPDFPGYVGTGDSKVEARKNIEEAIRQHIAPSPLDLPDDDKKVEATAD